jgi:NAD(P)-dependent dehydrogenase (short-subunit alcohol dehydrogenase family)
MKSFAGQVVVITGAASGIGRATARRFAREGARAHLVDVDAEGLEAVKSELEALGAKVTTHVVDCRDAEAVEALAQAVYGEPEQRVDVLHNNAGVCCGGAMEALTLEDWRWTLDINLWGVIHGVQAFLPKMIAQAGGATIVNTASMAGLVGLPMVAPYCTSKFAVVGLSEALNTELSRHGIRVIAICPGATRTKVMRNARLELPGAALDTLIPGLDRWGADPDVVAQKILRAVRRRSSFVATGIDMLPLWWLHRLSTRLYLGIARALTERGLRR